MRRYEMRRLTMTVLATAGLTGSLYAYHGLGAQQPAGPDFRPLEFLVGSCWSGPFAGSTKVDEHCFEWVFDRKFIRDRHIVRGTPDYRGETIYGWDPIAKKLSYWYWSSEGLVIVGTVEYTPDGIVFPSRYATAEGPVELKATWKQLGADAYSVSSAQRAGTGDWKTMWAAEMKRKR
jgi:hypothetical protein